MTAPRLTLIADTNVDNFQAIDVPPPLAPAGSGPHDPSMEARVAKLEAHIEHIQADITDIKTDVREMKKSAQTDFRLLFGALIAVALGIAGLMAKGFHWL